MSDNKNKQNSGSGKNNQSGKANKGRYIGESQEQQDSINKGMELAPKPKPKRPKN